jgi:hypothetical protein
MAKPELTTALTTTVSALLATVTSLAAAVATLLTTITTLATAVATATAAAVAACCCISTWVCAMKFSKTYHADHRIHLRHHRRCARMPCRHEWCGRRT